MPLLSLWKSSPGAVEQFTIEQVVATAGDGQLRDSSDCSTELREFLAQTPSDKLQTYVQRCLDAPFAKSGIVLQDLINELGRRLDYRVTNGRYQGVQNAIGFDGIWLSPEGHSIVAEVKTTDAYRIPLDKIAVYRDKLIENKSISPPVSILIIVGREDTGELESQVRGSRHAWDIRLISIDALFKLVKLKESADGTETGRKIRSLLIPVEYTRLDAMIDVMFTTAIDVETASQIAEPETSETTSETSGIKREKGVWEFTDRDVLQSKREMIVHSYGNTTGQRLIRKSASLHWDATHQSRVACAVSKLYTAKGSYRYWYAYHPAWDVFLSEGKQGHFILGCMDLNHAYAIPYATMTRFKDALNTTTLATGTMYWHVHLTDASGNLSMLQPKRDAPVNLEPFRFALSQK